MTRDATFSAPRDAARSHYYQTLVLTFTEQPRPRHAQLTASRGGWLQQRCASPSPVPPAHQRQEVPLTTVSALRAAIYLYRTAQLDSKIACRSRASVGRLTGSKAPVHHIIPGPRLFLSLSRISYS
jgi:hypothetical protein